MKHKKQQVKNTGNLSSFFIQFIKAHFKNGKKMNKTSSH